MRIPFVDLNAQYLSIKQEIDNAISSVVRTSAYIGGERNPFVKEFEDSFAKYIGAKHCIGCANGTDAIEILLKAYGIGPGDEVIVPALSWISTSEAVSNMGATPVFADILPDYYSIDPARIEEKITVRTKAIIPVHLYGYPAEMDEILSIASSKKLIIIEDCAQSHGAMYKGKMTGTLGHAASFSFYPSKNLGSYGDAGCMVTSDDRIAGLCRMISNHGQVEKHNHLMEGRNSRLDGIQAAILSVKLKYLKGWTEARIKNAGIYDSLLSPEIIPRLVKHDHSSHVYHLYVIQVKNRERVRKKLMNAGVETALHYPLALPFVNTYARFNYMANDFQIAKDVASRILSLPMYPELSRESIEFISIQLHEGLNE